MLPVDPVERAVVRAWVRYFDEVPTAAIRVPSFNMAFLARYDGLDDDAFQKEQADVRPLRKQFYERMGRKGFNDAEVDASLDQLHKTLERMETRLEKNEWITGKIFGLADIIILPLIDRMDDLSLGNMWSDNFPRVTDWFQRSKDRESFDEAFYANARLSEFLSIGRLRR
jgi:glutathione S-transferase